MYPYNFSYHPVARYCTTGLSDPLLRCIHCRQNAVEVPAVQPSYWPERIGVSALPSDSDIAEIQLVISRVQTDLVLLRSEMDRMLLAYMQLSDRQRALQQCVEEHSVLLAPVRKLPPEVLAEIFRRCLPEPHIQKSPDRRLTLLLLTQICRKWRDITLSTPDLWASLNMELNDSNMSHCVSVMTRWFSRAHGYPLSLDILGIRIWSNWNLQRLAETIVPLCSRLQDLTLYITSMFFDILPQIQATFPMLRSLKLQVFNQNASSDSIWPLKLFKLSPNLHSVYLDIHPSNVDLPWAQLTILHIGEHASVDTMQCRDLIQSCPNLDQCSFLSVISSAVSLSEPVLFHPSLRVARFTLDDRRPVIGLFDLFMFPNLQEFHLDYKHIGHTEIQFAEELIDFLSRSKAKITKLIANLALPSSFMITILHYLPALVELHIGVYPSASELAHLIATLAEVADGEFSICPDLMAFHLLDEPPLDGSRSKVNGELLNMVNARWRHSAAFSLRIEIWRPISLMSWKELKEQGLDVTIVDSKGGDWLGSPLVV